MFADFNITSVTKIVMVKYSSVTSLEKRYCHITIRSMVYELQPLILKVQILPQTSSYTLTTMRKWKLLGGKEIKTT